MKAITLFLFILIVSQSANAAQICDDYIIDEWPDSRYSIETISGDNVVTDNITGLMWKQCSEGLTGAGCMTGTVGAHNWMDALDLADAADFAGFSDWRVPNIKELRSIAAINCYDPVINEVVFPNTSANWYWSSSPVASDDGDAWGIFFMHGYGSYNIRNASYHVRLVRLGR